MASLVNQLQHALRERFKPGSSKHAAEKEMKQITVYSYKYRENLNDFSRDFGHYIKEHYPDIKQVKEINKTHVNAYLEDKLYKGRSSSYVAELRSCASKMGDIASSVYGCNTDWRSDVKGPSLQDTGKYKNLNMLTQEQWQDLKADISGCRGQSAIAVELAGAFGLRVRELTKITPKDIEQDGILHIHKSKGGRSRDLEVTTEEQRIVIDKLKELSEYHEPLQKIITVQPDSINKFYREHAEKIGVQDADVYGVHQLRRMYATELYHSLIGEGVEEQEAENKVSNWLGHGNNRPDVIERYVQK